MPSGGFGASAGGDAAGPDATCEVGAALDCAEAGADAVDAGFLGVEAGADAALAGADAALAGADAALAGATLVAGVDAATGCRAALGSVSSAGFGWVPVAVIDAPSPGPGVG